MFQKRGVLNQMCVSVCNFVYMYFLNRTNIADDLIACRHPTIKGMKCMTLLWYFPARIVLYSRPWHTYRIVATVVGLPDKLGLLAQMRDDFHPSIS